MKKRYAIIMTALVSIICSCEKDPVVSTHDKVGISKVTYYPNFTLTGNDVISIVQGTSFSDPGVKASAGGVDIPVTATGTVDASTVGMYVLTYTAVNADGFSATATRTVIVIPSAEVQGVDLSGTYDAVSASAGTALITKVAPGVYYTTNCWNGATVIPVYFISVDGNFITIPTQTTGFGRIETTMPATYINGLITWELNLLDQGSLIRTRKWQKQ